MSMRLCPFCGGDKLSFKSDRVWIWVQCNCGARGSIVAVKNRAGEQVSRMAAGAWNGRAPKPKGRGKPNNIAPIELPQEGAR